MSPPEEEIELRDYLAAAALNAMIPKEPWPWGVSDEGVHGPIPMLAMYSYLIADAMIEARKMEHVVLRFRLKGCKES